MNSKDFLFYLMIVIVIGLTIYLIYFTKTEALNCMNSPLTYGVSKLTTSNNAEISCSCYSPGSTERLIFNKDNLTTFNSVDEKDLIYSVDVPSQEELKEMGFNDGDTVIITTSDTGTSFTKQ